MLRPRFKKVLLVAPEVFPEQLSADCKIVRHITNTGSIFPSLYELQPDMIILDYDYFSKDIEKVLRRININQFYNKMKVCCYKSMANTKVDEFLKVLGVDFLIYTEDFVKPEKSKTILNNMGGIFDLSIVRWVANV